MAQKKSKATRRAESTAASERAAAIRAEQERLERRRRSIGVTVAVLVVLAVIGGIGFALQSSRDTTGKATTPPAGVVGTYGIPDGKASAPVTVTIYEDFMCPYCGELEAANRAWVQQYVDQGKMRVDYRVLAFLDRASNGTEYSSRSANAIGVVLDTSGPDVAQKFHALLFEHQPSEGSDGLSDSQLVDYAVQAGAKRADVEQAIKDRKFSQWVVNGTNDASKNHGVTGTPTVLVDGQQVTGQTMQQLSANVKQAVDAKQG